MVEPKDDPEPEVLDAPTAANNCSLMLTSIAVAAVGALRSSVILLSRPFVVVVSTETTGEL